MKKVTREHRLMVGSTATLKILQALKVELGGDTTLNSALSFLIISRSEIFQFGITNKGFLEDYQPHIPTGELKEFSELPRFNFRPDLLILNELPTEDQTDSPMVQLTKSGKSIARRIFRKVLGVMGSVKF